MYNFKRFITYSLIGFSTFLFDLALLFALTEIFGIHYVWAAGFSFLVAVSVNYAVSRTFVFKGTTRSKGAGYIYFLLIAGAGLMLVLGTMYVLVEIAGVYYLLARVLVSGISGIWNYIINLLYNFKISDAP